LDIAYYHHEWWDGSGYPSGLKGNNIPLSARVFAVVDVWDALLSDRPYRSAMKKPEVVKYIRSLSGKQFDPDVVEVFLTMIKEKAMKPPGKKKPGRKTSTARKTSGPRKADGANAKNRKKR
jgi:HD-GYP domain-containing protein (c-di-GMP phosphodiesterase class II)